MKKYTVTKATCYIGYVVQAIACTFLPLLYVIFRKNYNFSYEQLGRLVFVLFAIQIFVDLFSIKLVSLLGFRKTAVLSQAFAAFGFTSLCFLPKIMEPYTAIMISVIIYGIGSGLIEVVVSPIVEYLPTKDKSGNMAVLHSFFCWGNVFVVICTTIMLYFMGEDKWGYISLVWAIVPVITGILFLFVPIVEPNNSKSHSIKELLSSPLFYAMLFLMLFAGASEISVSNWISAFAEQSLNITKLIADLVGPCLFAACMGIGRVGFSLLGDKVSIKKVLLIMSFFTAVFYIVLAMSKNAVLSLAAGGIIGICVSVMWPGVLSYSSLKFPHGTTAMFALLAMFGDFGCSAGPWLTGVIADTKNLNTGFLVGTIFPALMFLLILIIDRKRVKK